MQPRRPSLLLPGGILKNIQVERSAFGKNDFTGPALAALVAIFYRPIRFLFDTRIEYCSSRDITSAGSAISQSSLGHPKLPIPAFVPPLFPRNKCPILTPHSSI
jgi:hypothetical protein